MPAQGQGIRLQKWSRPTGLGKRWLLALCIAHTGRDHKDDKNSSFAGNLCYPDLQKKRVTEAQN